MKPKKYRVTFINDEDGGELDSFDSYDEAVRYAQDADADAGDTVRVETDADTYDDQILWESE